MKTIIDSIRDNDTEYDPIGFLSRDEREQFHRAYRRVSWDGYHGPYDDDTWDDEIGGYRMTVREALSIMRRAYDRADDYIVTDLWYCDTPDTPDDDRLCDDADIDTCPGHAFEANRIDKADIFNALIPAIRAIYGYGIEAMSA